MRRMRRIERAEQAGMDDFVGAGIAKGAAAISRRDAGGFQSDHAATMSARRRAGKMGAMR
jgi:hypothetical protein